MRKISITLVWHLSAAKQTLAMSKATCEIKSVSRGSHYVVIADDSQRQRSAIGATARRYGYEAHVFASFEEAYAGAAMLHPPPEAAIIDAEWSGGRCGLDLASRFRSLFPGILTILLSTSLPAPSGELPRDTAIEAIARDELNLRSFLVRSAVNHHLACSPRHRQAIVELCLRFDLSPQESRVVAQLAAGTTRSRLSAALVINEETLRAQIRRILVKLDCASSDEIVALILQRTGHGEPQEDLSEHYMPLRIAMSKTSTHT